ncbi:MAG: hypothetical protein IT452_00985 [Planctomycetia bacterium]|nr:hypothetical protein [Planctomycetia bacterium]
MTPGDWKRWYEAERAALGERVLEALVAGAPDVRVSPGGALVFPHARLRDCGSQVAAVARAVVESGAETVVALGVLHGGGTAPPAEVAAAKAGDAAALARLRRVHGPGVPGDAGLWRDEFSLDNFRTLVAVAASRAGRRAPRLVVRFPYLVGTDPASLPGLEALRIPDAVLVATTDPAHHGHGYGTPPDAMIDDAEPSSAHRVHIAIRRAFDHLARRQFRAFLMQCDEWKSDFRDTGPAMTALLDGPLAARIHDLRLVDYSDVLAAPRPTWVAAALAEFAPERK